MKGFGWTVSLLILSLVYLDAFVPPKVHAPSSRRRHPNRRANLEPSKNDFSTMATLGIWKRNVKSQSNLWSSTNDIDNVPSQQDPFTHADILWKLRPARDVPIWRKLWLKIAANLIRLDCVFKKVDPPLVLCPKGGQAVLEAHIECKDGGLFSRLPWRRRKKIGRFGFTTMAGPSNVPIQETIHDLYDLDANRPYRAGAIIYMFVEEAFRKVGFDVFRAKCVSRYQYLYFPFPLSFHL